MAALLRNPRTRVLAALGPKMLELAAKRTNGAHTYNVTPEHTATARSFWARVPGWCVEQAVVLESDRCEGAKDCARFSCSLSHSAELHQQLSPPRLHRGRLQGRRQRSPDRCDCCLGRRGGDQATASMRIYQPEPITCASRRCRQIRSNCRSREWRELAKLPDQERLRLSARAVRGL